MKLTPSCLQFLKDNEGFRGEAYQDSVGVWTIGYGSARTFRGQPIYPGMTCTEEEASEALEEDIPKYQTFLSFFKKTFNSNQVGALTSFEYNVGGGVFISDGWNPSFSDQDIIDSLNNYHRPPEIIARRDREVALYQTPPGDEWTTPEPGDPDGTKTDSPPPGAGSSDLTDKMKKLVDKVSNDISQGVANDIVYNYVQGYSKSGYAVSTERIYGNVDKVTINESFIKDVIAGIDIGNGGQDGPDVPPPPDPNPPGEPGKPIESGKIMQQLYDWANARQGQSFDFDGWYGAQCVDLITWLNREFSLGLNLAGPTAISIWSNELPPGWSRVNGVPTNDEQSRVIWDTLPLGAIVYFQYLDAGHVALKGGGWCICLGQNQDGGGAAGGPIRKTQLESWLRSGAGFQGAWVANAERNNNVSVEDEMNYKIKDRFGNNFAFKDYVAGIASDLAILREVAEKIEKKIDVSRETKEK